MTELFAHRGYTADRRENTLEAFRQAARRGADGVELDVRRAADGALVVHHDAVLEGLGALCELERRRLPSYVPTLGEALEACGGLLVNVEIKNDPGEPGFDPADRVAADCGSELASSGRLEQVIVSSFRAECLEVARAAAPALSLGLLVGWWDDAPAALGRARERGYGAVHPFVTQVDGDLVAKARAAGTALRVWTVNAPADLVQMCRLGVDAVITDQLEAAQRARAALGP